MTTSSTSQNSDNWPRSVKTCIWLAVALVVAGIGLLVFDLIQTKNNTDWGNPGIRGDFYGGHLAAASGLAGTLLFFAALLLQARELGFQREQLALQLDEFKQSREVAEQQAMALEEQTSELKAQNDNLKRQVGMSESREETQLILSLASQVQRIEGIISAPSSFSTMGSDSLPQSQERLVRFAARRVVLRFYVDRLNAEMNLQLFVAHLPKRLHEFVFKRMEASAIEVLPSPSEDVGTESVQSWVKLMKTLITENIL